MAASYQDIEQSWYTEHAEPQQPIPTVLHNMTQRRFLEMEGAHDPRYIHPSEHPYGNANDVHSHQTTQDCSYHPEDVAVPPTSLWLDQHYDTLYGNSAHEPQYQQQQQQYQEQHEVSQTNGFQMFGYQHAPHPGRGRPYNRGCYNERRRYQRGYNNLRYNCSERRAPNVQRHYNGGVGANPLGRETHGDRQQATRGRAYSYDADGNRPSTAKSVGQKRTRSETNQHDEETRTNCEPPSSTNDRSTHQDANDVDTSKPACKTKWQRLSSYNKPDSSESSSSDDEPDDKDRQQNKADVKSNVETSVHDIGRVSEAETSAHDNGRTSDTDSSSSNGARNTDASKRRRKRSSSSSSSSSSISGNKSGETTQCRQNATDSHAARKNDVECKVSSKVSRRHHKSALNSREKRSASPVGDSDIERDRRRRSRSRSSSRKSQGERSSRGRRRSSKSSREDSGERTLSSSHTDSDTELTPNASSCRRTQAYLKPIAVPVERRRSPSPLLAEIERQPLSASPSVGIYEFIDNKSVTVLVSDHEDERIHDKNPPQQQRDVSTSTRTQRSNRQREQVGDVLTPPQRSIVTPHPPQRQPVCNLLTSSATPQQQIAAPDQGENRPQEHIGYNSSATRRQIAESDHANRDESNYGEIQPKQCARDVLATPPATRRRVTNHVTWDDEHKSNGDEETRTENVVTSSATQQIFIVSEHYDEHSNGEAMDRPGRVFIPTLQQLIDTLDDSGSNRGDNQQQQQQTFRAEDVVFQSMQESAIFELEPRNTVVAPSEEQQPSNVSSTKTAVRKNEKKTKPAVRKNEKKTKPVVRKNEEKKTKTAVRKNEKKTKPVVQKNEEKKTKAAVRKNEKKTKPVVQENEKKPRRARNNATGTRSRKAAKKTTKPLDEHEEKEVKATLDYVLGRSTQEAAVNDVCSSALAQANAHNLTSGLQSEAELCACSSSTCTTYTNCPVKTAAAVAALIAHRTDDYASRTIKDTLQSFHEMYNPTTSAQREEKYTIGTDRQAREYSQPGSLDALVQADRGSHDANSTTSFRAYREVTTSARADDAGATTLPQADGCSHDANSTTSSRAYREVTTSARADDAGATTLPQADRGSHDAKATTSSRAEGAGAATTSPRVTHQRHSGSSSDTLDDTIRFLTKCNICCVGFNSYLICNDFYISFNQPMQCACGCVVCTQCYTQSNDVRCHQHGTKLKTGLVNITANILSHTRHVYTDNKWDTILDSNPAYKAPTEQNHLVQQMIRCHTNQDVLRQVYTTLLDAKDDIAFKYFSRSPMKITDAYRYVAMSHTVNFWNHIVVGTRMPNTADTLAPATHLCNLYDVSMGMYTFHWSCFVFTTQVVFAMWCVNTSTRAVVPITAAELAHITDASEFNLMIYFLRKWIEAHYNRIVTVVLDSSPREMFSFKDVITWIAAKCGMNTTLSTLAFSTREVNRVPLCPTDSMFMYPRSTEHDSVYVDIENDFNTRHGDRADNGHVHARPDMYAFM